MSNNSDFFKNEVKIDRNKQRLFNLKRQLDNGEIEIEEIAEQDIEKLIKLYDSEVKDIKSETSQIKERIKKELKELKRKNTNE